jgi:enoyl-CoA hydratase/carnithine racemase
MDQVAVLISENPDPGVVLLRLNRPERLNALNGELVSALSDACTAIATDDLARVVVLTGTGRGFCSGLDLRGFGAGVPEESASPLDRFRFQEMMGSLPGRLRGLPQPVIAAVNGPAVGGGLALCLGADIRICASSASFGNAAIRLGLSGAEMGMSYHLPRIVGTSVAADWMLTGRTVSADEAFRCGLVSALVDDDRLLVHALELAGQIVSHPALAVEMTKRALQVNVDSSDLGAALELENRNQVITSTTEASRSARNAWKR